MRAETETQTRRAEGDMRMAKGFGEYKEARRQAAVLLDETQRGEIRLGHKTWLSTWIQPTATYHTYVTIARDGNLTVQARGLTRGEQIASGKQSEWIVVEAA